MILTDTGTITGNSGFPLAPGIGDSEDASFHFFPQRTPKRETTAEIMRGGLELVRENPYSERDLKFIDPESHPTIEHFKTFVRLGKEYRLISKVGSINFNKALAPERLRELYGHLEKFIATESPDLRFLVVHAKLLMACLLITLREPQNYKTVARRLVNRASLDQGGYEITDDITFKLNSCGIRTARFPEKTQPFPHLSSRMKSATPRFVIFGGSGDSGIRNVLPGLFKAKLAKNDKRQGFLSGDSEIIVVLNDKEESELTPRRPMNAETEESIKIAEEWRQKAGEHLALEEDRTFTRHVVESSINLGLHPPHKVGRYIEMLQRIQCVPGYKGRHEKEFWDTVEAAQSHCDLTVFFASTPPSQFPDILRAVEKSLKFGKVILWLEKPLGDTPEQTQKLIELIEKSSGRLSVYGMDHYLGKPAISLLIYAKRNFLDKYLNNKFVESIEINGAESLGLGDRIKAYDKTGVIPDMLESHLLQLLALVCMDLPDAKICNSASFTDSKLRFLQQIAAFEPEDCVVGQNETHKAELGDPNSKCPTCVAGKTRIVYNDPEKLTDSKKRWEGVDFYFRFGKQLNTHNKRMPKRSQIVIKFRDDVTDPDCPKKIILRIQPKPCLLIYPRDGSEPDEIYLDEISPVSQMPDYGNLFYRMGCWTPLAIDVKEAPVQSRVVAKITDRERMTPVIYANGSEGPELAGYEFHPFV